MKRRAFRIDLILALSVFALAGFVFVSFAKANFVIPPPKINVSVIVQSPEDKVYSQSKVPVAFTVEGVSQGWNIPPSGFTYKLDEHAPVRFSAGYAASGSSYHCSATLYGLSEGSHDLVISVQAEYADMGNPYRWIAISKPVSFTINAAAPRITVLSPNQGTYNATSFSLVFGVSEQVSWMGYSLNGAATRTINGNTTFTEITDGTHTLIVYATDTAGTQGASQPITFSVKTQETQVQETTSTEQSEDFQTVLVATVLVSVAAAVVAGFLAYLAKSKKEAKGNHTSQSFKKR